MLKNLTWNFAETGGGDETGFNDSAISNFLGDISYKLVREALQNSIDAGEKKPVLVEFDLKYINTSKIPGIQELRKVYSLCIDYWSKSSRQDKDVKETFNKLITNIHRDLEIPVLRISDYNTRGLTPKDYYTLFQSVGASLKGIGEGGSFGLGKGAYFMSSLFRMVFVSSNYGKNKYYFAGKTRLVSHEKDGKPIQGNGTYGYIGQKPVEESEDIPIMFRREEKGTDFYIYGYQSNKNWHDEIIKAVLENFWYSILINKLEIKIGKTKIDKDNIEELMKKYYSNLKSKAELNKSPYPHFRACVDPERIHIQDELPTLGKVDLFVIKDETYPKRMSYVRITGMTIYTQQITTTYGYAGVFVCENKEGNEILRKMENPEHDEWNKDIGIISGKLSKKVAENAAKELKSFVIKTLKSLHDSEEGEIIKIKDLAKYLWLPQDEEPILSNGGSEGDEKRGEKESAPVVNVVDDSKLKIISKKKKLNVDKKSEKGRADDEGDLDTFGRNGGGGGGGEKKKGESDSEGDIFVIPKSDFKYRSYATKEDGGYVHTLILRVKNTNLIKKAVIRVGTDNSMDDVDLWSAVDKETEKNYKTEGNIIHDIDLNRNGEKILKLTFTDDNKYSLNVTVYENR